MILNLNRTTIYCLPLVTDIYDKSMMAYIGVRNLDDIEYNIYVTSDPHIEQLLQKQKCYIGKTVYNKKHVSIFSIEKEFLKDYDNFLIGNYKLIKSKNKILNYWKNKNKKIYNYIYNVFYNAEDLHDIIIDVISTSNRDRTELSDIFDKNQEVDSIIKLKEEILIN